MLSFSLIMIQLKANFDSYLAKNLIKKCYEKLHIACLIIK